MRRATHIARLHTLPPPDFPTAPLEMMSQTSGLYGGLTTRPVSGTGARRPPQRRDLGTPPLVPGCCSQSGLSGLGASASARVGLWAELWSIAQGVRWADLCDAEPAQVLVKSLTGKTVTVELDLADFVGAAKLAVEAKLAIPVGCQRLLFQGRQLEDHRPVGFYFVTRGSTLHLVARLRGGNCVLEEEAREGGRTAWLKTFWPTGYSGDESVDCAFIVDSFLYCKSRAERRLNICRSCWPRSGRNRVSFALLSVRAVLLCITPGTAALISSR